MSASGHRARSGSALRKLLTVLCGIALFLVMVALLGVWAAGRFSPRLLDSSLSSKSGAHLSVEENETNLFAGRVAYSGLTLTNPSRWSERDFLRVRRLVLEVDPLTFFEGGAQVVEEAELDVEHLTLVGKEDYLSDNNAKDIFNGLKGAPEPAAKPDPGQPAKKQPFLIRHLRVRVGHLTVIAGDGTPQRRVVVDQRFDLVFEARDVTERDFDAKVSRPFGAQAAQAVVSRQPELIMDLARERLRKSVTEKLLGEK